MFRKKSFLTAAQLQAEVDNWSDDEEEYGGKNADAIDIIVVPPDPAEVSDVEDLDEEVLANDANPQIQEVAGTFEVLYTFNDEAALEQMSTDDNAPEDVSSDDEPVQAKRRKICKRKSVKTTTIANTESQPSSSSNSRPEVIFKEPIWNRDSRLFAS